MFDLTVKDHLGKTITTLAAHASGRYARISWNGTAISVSSATGAFPLASDSADHSADEHLIEEMDILCGPANAGVGFTLFARTRTGKLYDQWNVNWLRR